MGNVVYMRDYRAQRGHAELGFVAASVGVLFILGGLGLVALGIWAVAFGWGLLPS